VKNYIDAFNLTEDQRCRLIAERVTAGEVVGFMVETDAKADRYMRRIKKIEPRATETFRGPAVEGVILVKLKLSGEPGN
jgi:hypothetical protein